MGDWTSLLPRLSKADRRWVERDLASAEARLRTLLNTSREALSLDAVPNGCSRSYALALHRLVCHGELIAAELPELTSLATRNVPWRLADLLWCLKTAAYGGQMVESVAHLQLPVAIAAQLDPDLLIDVRPALTALFSALAKNHRLYTDPRRRLLESLGRVLDGPMPGVPWWLLHDGDEFGSSVRAELGGVLTRPGVPHLLAHCATLERPLPGRAWRQQMEHLLADADSGRHAACAVLERFAGHLRPVHDDTDRLIRGLAWAAAGDQGEETTELLARLAWAAAIAPASAPGFPAAPRTAAAVVEILTSRAGETPVLTLARLSILVRNKALSTRLKRALDALGALRGWAPGEALEIAVDDHGLDADGRLVEEVGEHEAIIEIVGERARLRFAREGRPLTSVPRAVKADHAERLGELRRRVKEIAATLAAERQRVEALLSGERVWAHPEWVSRYLNHPVTAVYARRLLWETRASATTAAESPTVEAAVDGATGQSTGWRAGLPRRDADGWVLEGLDGKVVCGQRIRLWHLMRAEVDEVMRWRDHIIASGLRQPFKQAFREVYLLAPAERTTGTYSNRFAGHILRYRQANALMRVRGWHASYLGGWDGGGESEAVKEFAGGAWRASFYHELVEGRDGNRDEARYCSTDQVRFDRRDGAVWQNAPLAEVPPLVFSEAMRDVDLFIGVTSIATDPQWNDRGEDRFNGYWQQAVFGELTPSADVRRDALARLLPRMRIAERCELTERFLRVRGNLRTYKIHVGSANILMEPNDEYLCIVPARNNTNGLHLPFDEDPVLPVLLSKALMLAADDRITDPSILRQIANSRCAAEPDGLAVLLQPARVVGDRRVVVEDLGGAGHGEVAQAAPDV